jgi:hypothetical protein
MTASAGIDGRIDWYGTYAALVAAFPSPSFPAGTAAYTSDLGEVYWSGSSWAKSTVTTIAANSGAAQTGATPLTAKTNAVTSAGAGYSVLLPVSEPGMEITVLTVTATNTVTVFPNAGGTTTETINALSANAGITMAARTRAIFYCVVAGQWYTLPLLPS